MYFLLFLLYSIQQKYKLSLLNIHLFSFKNYMVKLVNIFDHSEKYNKKYHDQFID